MRILSQTVSNVKTTTYKLIDGDTLYTYIEYIDIDTDTLIDCNLRGESGEEIDNANLLERAQELADRESIG